MKEPIKMAGETLTHAKTLLVRLIDEEGREGWGEASAAPLMTGETLASVTASTEYLIAKLLGVQMEEPADIAWHQEKVLYGNASAKSCVEVAIMDLFAQRRGLPLHALLAGETVGRSGPLEMMHMLASGNLEKELEEADTLRTAGYRHWKIKIGSLDSAQDILRIQSLCSSLQGDTVSADANQALSLEAAAEIASAGFASGLAFLEQPFQVGEANEMAKLHRSTGLSLCADESIQSKDDIVAHHKIHAAQGVSLKLIKLGGSQALIQAGRLCLQQGIHINLACKVAETTISAAATAHAGFALGNIAWGFSMSNRYLEADVCMHPLTPKQGAITLDQLNQPGLGFAPERDRLCDFASASVPKQELNA